MAIKDLIPWNRGHQAPAHRGEEYSPFMTLHREVNRLFDDVLRDFHVTPFASDRYLDRSLAWPNIEVSETDGEMKIVAELPGLEEKDVQVELADDVLVIKGEKKTESENHGQRFSERYYGSFERRIPVEDVDDEKVSAKFKNGVLTLTLPKTPTAQSKVKRIPIGG
jgi:HSP20 family protein